MARIFFMAFDSAGQTPMIKKLRAAGHRLAVTEPKYPAFLELLKQQNPPPEAFVVDCSKLPSHARESSNYIRSLRAHREAPFLLYNVKREDEPTTRQRVPGATIAFDDRIDDALRTLFPSTGTPGVPPGNSSF